MSDGGASEARRQGRQKMQEVYGFSVDPADVEGPYVAMTVDHLFGEVWTRSALDIRDRRLLTMGVLAAHGLQDLLTVQCRAALARGELDADQLREVVVHLAHYVGWPLSTAANQAVETAVAEHRAARPG
jgi:4-carboxymuconolactone decarboxylase